MSNPPLVVIVGPTASGKSDFAMRVAKRWGGELICADSRTVYRGMDIGTAKPSPADRDAVPHHLLDVVEPDQPFTTADFKTLANQAIADIWARGRLPIMVGGTGLYVDSVLFDFQFGEPADPVRRAELSAMSIEELQKICSDNNIELPMNNKNKRHLIRAIELGGLIKNNRSIRANTIVVGLTINKEDLEQRIRLRAQQMVLAGVKKEVEALAEHYGYDNQAMSGNIYRVFKDVTEGLKTTDQAIDDSIKTDISLAKRQRTWFKRNPHIVWGTPEELMPVIAKFVDAVKR